MASSWSDVCSSHTVKLMEFNKVVGESVNMSGYIIEEYMGSWRCGISLWLFNSKSHVWAQWASEISSWTEDIELNRVKRMRCHLFVALNRASDMPATD